MDMGHVRLETCVRCNERGFAMGLKDEVCHRCFLRDTDAKKRPVTPFLMSVTNMMDPGPVPAHLPELTQVEEMVIARAHVQMLVKRVRGHQYQYTGHCVTFMQDIVRTVNVLPLLPSELDIVLLRPPGDCEDAPRYRRQFQADFRVRRQHVVTWLHFLRENHPDYRDITLSTARIAALPEDDDVSSSVPYVTDDTLTAEEAVELLDAPPPTLSMVVSVTEETTEADLILADITGRRRPPPGIPAPEIRRTPIDEISGKERVLSQAFPTLYPTGLADINTPRLRSVALKDYARHLLCWHDTRFAQHARWRFLVFNMFMRQRARSTAQFYVSRASHIKDLTREELAEALDTDATLLQQIVRQGSMLPGTRPYWKSRASSLQAHARFLSTDAAPVFVTFSCADMQWHDLQRHLPGFADYETGDDRARQKIVWSNIQDCPHIVAHYLDIRFRTFLKRVVYPYLKVTDHWYRYEWQHRGSGHLHCLFWTESGPPLDPSTEEDRAAFAAYWGERVTAWLPDRHRLPDARNPASLLPSAVVNTADQFTAFANRLQKHTICRPSYCLRTKKAGGEPYCRFFFPRPLTERAIITKDINHKDYMFAPARNHTLLNQCSPAITMGWMANTDIQPPLTLHALLTYIGKYVSKPEKASVSYTELQAQVLSRTNDRAPLLSFVSKLFNKLIGERDWSAQEVCHVLLDLPSQDATRQVTTLDCRPEEVQNDAITVEGESVTTRRSALQRYQDRMADQVNPALLAVSLFEWLREWNWILWTKRPRAPERVINYYPRYSSDPSSEAYNDYCRVRLMLHHPFTSLTDLFTVDGCAYGSYGDAFSACRRLHTHPDDFYTDPVTDEPDADSEDEDSVSDEDGPPADFEVLARRRPGRADLTCSFTDDLGRRELDRVYSWMPHVGRNLTTLDAWSQFKLRHNTVQAVIVDSDPRSLNTEQRRLYDTVTGQYAHELTADCPPRPLLLNVDGVAGSGKTYTLLKICARLQELAQESGLSNPVVRAAPTGVAAFNIVGRTLHSLFWLPVKRKDGYADLSNASLHELQAFFAHIRFVIIDEKSMIGLKVLSTIDNRLRQIVPDRADQPFGGLNLLLCGDFFQLPPVSGHALFARTAHGPEALKGQSLYRAFDRTVRLTQVMRQQGEDDIAVRFRTALGELRESRLSQSSWELLSTRVQHQLLPAEVASFQSALRLYFRNAEVRARNYDQLAATHRPVKKIVAKHTGRNASKATREEADNLPAEILLSVGARVMLTANLWTEKGLVNGSIGTVTDVVWGVDQDPSVSMPSIVLVCFHEYSGPDYPCYGSKVIPVFPALHQFEFKGASCTRMQFPLRLAYAITVHKSQGLTLSRVVLDIDQKEHCLGLTYVAVSRVKSLQGLMFESSFDYSRFTGQNSPVAQDRELDLCFRSNQLL